MLRARLLMCRAGCEGRRRADSAGAEVGRGADCGPGGPPSLLLGVGSAQEEGA